jgi:hypothetical protein
VAGSVKMASHTSSGNVSEKVVKLRDERFHEFPPRQSFYLRRAMSLRNGQRSLRAPRGGSGAEFSNRLDDRPTRREEHPVV